MNSTRLTFSLLDFFCVAQVLKDAGFDLTSKTQRRLGELMSPAADGAPAPVAVTITALRDYASPTEKSYVVVDGGAMVALYGPGVSLRSAARVPVERRTSQIAEKEKKGYTCVGRWRLTVAAPKESAPTTTSAVLRDFESKAGVVLGFELF